MLAVGILGFGRRVKVDIDHIVEHPDCRSNCRREQLVIQNSVCDVGSQVNRAEIANCRFQIGSIEKNLGAQVAAVDDACVILR